MSGQSVNNSKEKGNATVSTKPRNTIESSVTRLLVSTKHLLESLTQWARKEADDRFVSDAYVKLGNDFRIATRAFTNAGVDVSDIGDVPQELRVVLEAALSEAPTQENLDRFLPNIRNIIVSLLQKLNSKQLKAKSFATEDGGTKRQDSSLRLPEGPQTSKIRSEDDHRQSYSNSKNKAASGALAQLQKGDSLQRRASKRFSAYQYAKLANKSPNLALDGLSTEEQSEQEDSINSLQEYPTSKTPRKSSGSINIFLRIETRTKKVTISLPVSVAALRLLFVKTFAFSPGASSFPDIYITDPKGTFSYELEENMLGSEVKEGCLLSLKESANAKDNTKIIEDRIKLLDSKFESLKQVITSDVQGLISESNNRILTELNESIKRIEVAPPQEKTPISKCENPERSILQNNDLKQLKFLQQELRVLKQVQQHQLSVLKESIADLMSKIKEFRENGLDVSKSSNRAYMDNCNTKLSEGSDALLTKVDDLQDIIEAMRKDIAQRGVRASDKHLKSIHKEIQDAKRDLKDMASFINSEKGQWKKIWENELDKVCEEQQFFNLQDDLTKYLDEDLKKIEETFELIEQCTLEQGKQGAQRKNKFVANLYIPEPGESVHDIRHEVLNEVAALCPDHEKRLQAIQKAEKLRDKERDLMKLNRFQEELGDFVDDNKLKKSGGVEELERARQQKDYENLKSSLGVI